MTVLPAQTANMLVRAQKEIRMALPTDQKVGGSSPSEHVRRLRRSGPPTGLIDPVNWPRWCCPDSHADSHRGDAPCQQPGGTYGCPAGWDVTDRIYIDDVEVNGYRIEPGAHLAGARLSRANLERANLSGARLSRAHLREVHLAGANLSKAHLAGANLLRAWLSNANLSEANLAKANLTGANLSRANLFRAHLRGANLSEVYLSGANLSGARLSRVRLRGANLYGVDLTKANLAGAYLYGAYLAEANLAGANLTRTALTWADLSGAFADQDTRWPEGFDPVAAGVTFE